MKLTFMLAIGILSSLASYSQTINGSYLNITRSSGGPIDIGDILELRSVISVSSGTNITSLYYTDNVPTGTTFVSGSLKVVTNENLVVPAIPNTGNYTDAAGDDRGSISGTAITIYMGTGATVSAGGSVNGGSTTPVFQTGTSILMVAYQVKVTTSYNSLITTGGTFSYIKGGTPTTTAVAAGKLLVTAPYGCSGTTGSNLLTAETNGTFGSGTVQNRASSSSNVTGYTFTALSATAPVDGQYSIVKNTSPTQYSGGSPASGDKVYGVWDVMGDHTGTSTATGNTPPGNGVSQGYLLAVNATFTPAAVFSTSIAGLTPHSIYTISFWIRNICPVCGNNPATGAATTTPGVKPNLAININGNNYYSSGDIPYTGQWVQKSFTFQAGSSTVVVFDVKNNAPGGGGNDWVLDDITFTACSIVLPLGLQSFSGHPSSRGITLDWQMQPTPEILSFIVERSTDGSSFLPINEQTAYPDSANYQFTDPLLPVSGVMVYYRIKLVTFDGTTSYSNVVSLKTDNSSGSGVLTTRLAPNPARTITTLAIQSANAGPAQIMLLSPAGGRIYSRGTTLIQGTNAIELALPSNLPTGIYFIKTTSGSGSAISRLIVE